MGLFAKRVKISGLIVIGKQMPLGVFLSSAEINQHEVERKWESLLTLHTSPLERMKLYLARPGPFLRSVINVLYCKKQLMHIRPYFIQWWHFLKKEIIYFKQLSLYISVLLAFQFTSYHTESFLNIFFKYVVFFHTCLRSTMLSISTISYTKWRYRYRHL